MQANFGKKIKENPNIWAILRKKTLEMETILKENEKNPTLDENKMNRKEILKEFEEVFEDFKNSAGLIKFLKEEKNEILNQKLIYQQIENEKEIDQLQKKTKILETTVNEALSAQILVIDKLKQLEESKEKVKHLEKIVDSLKNEKKAIRDKKEIKFKNFEERKEFEKNPDILAMANRMKDIFNQIEMAISDENKDLNKKIISKAIFHKNMKNQ